MADKTENLAGITGEKREEGLLSFSENAMRLYGTEVVEQRAVPDYRDGLKPVHRCILWSMYKLGASPTGRYYKAARVVGDVIGLYHPHGDCLSGDTRIPLLSGKSPTIQELVESDSGKKWVMAYDEESNSFVPAVAHSWRIGKRSKVSYRITFATGESITCTDNHPYYVKDEGWVRTDELVVGDTLIGGSILTTKRGYPYLYSNTTKPTEVHKIVGNYKYGKLDSGYVYHHVNENIGDNRPKNIQLLSRGEHATLHGDYKTGLSNSRKEMFSKGGKYRKATKKKNSALMREVNNFMWLYKAFKAIKLLDERGIKVTKKSYESLRSEIYNLTRLTKLSLEGINSFTALREFKQNFKLDTTSAKGFTRKLNPIKVKNSYTKTYGEDYKNTTLMRLISKVLLNLVKKGISLKNCSWKDYRKQAKKLAKSNQTKVLWLSSKKLKKHFAVSTVQELIELMPANCLTFITNIVRITAKEKENFYDFTVDKYHNMLVYTSNGQETGNYVVAHNSSAYQAMVKMVNSPQPLIDGYGNWGSHVDGAAAYRYTESRLSKFADKILLDPDYLAVSDMIPNFSEDKELPLILPAKLPIALLLGSTSIAFGVAASMPSFELAGVAALSKLAIQNKEVTVVECLKHLKFKYTYGGKTTSPKADIKSLFLTGKGSLTFVPEYAIDVKNKEFIINGLCPGLQSAGSIEKLLNNIVQLTGVKGAVDETNKDGIRLLISFNKGLTEQKFLDACKDIEKMLPRRESYDIGVTERKKDGAKFYRMSIPDIFKNWAVWRVELEKKVITHLLTKEQDKLNRLLLLIFAIDNLKVILESLSSKDPKAVLVKRLSISEEKADAILDLRVRQLAKLERSPLVVKQKEVEKEIKSLQKDLKNPLPRITNDIDHLMKEI